ncbi:MAG: ATPase inhibitor subunit zeta, partial [Pseudomonadota bacterium]
LMNLTDEETDAYKKSVVQADFEEAGDEDVIRKLLGDLTAAETDVSEADIRAKLDEMAVEAKRQIMSEL